ncbi:hypothetical protein H920_15070 [Fukomys damarensis]|uniref:Uncharacterized protein n=1 Tax=Fukomys damarensis TaxID=885580 RepID=A0A091CZ19_FUKDA|nr:hypothetical protein H920_15070 [Fukomys damarensis]
MRTGERGIPEGQLHCGARGLAPMQRRELDPSGVAGDFISIACPPSLVAQECDIKSSIPDQPVGVCSRDDLCLRPRATLEKMNRTFPCRRKMSSRATVTRRVELGRAEKLSGPPRPRKLLLKTEEQENLHTDFSEDPASSLQNSTPASIRDAASFSPTGQRPEASPLRISVCIR